ncbi:MAG: helix-hairpin-helix domain-containing protein, partial [Atopobiaceae bacterium]|nr:helix-hairpin-helix domain-containing protein [Atopobiaceae bacterium]
MSPSTGEGPGAGVSRPSDGHALQRLLDELGRLPGIGPKSAQRIAYHLLSTDTAEATRLADAILDVKQQVHFCPVCFAYATRDTCDICADASRDR